MRTTGVVTAASRRDGTQSLYAQKTDRPLIAAATQTPTTAYTIVFIHGEPLAATLWTDGIFPADSRIESTASFELPLSPDILDTQGGRASLVTDGSVPRRNVVPKF